MEQQILRKAYSTNPTYGTYWDTKQYSEIPRLGIFPYPFYFVSDAFDDEPTVYPRRAGWSPEYNLNYNQTILDNYPSHCFQTSWNTIDTKKKTNNGCVSDECIVLER